MLSDDFIAVEAVDFNCKSISKQQREKCHGYCNSYQNDYAIINDVIINKASCKCCRARETYNQTVSMYCLPDPKYPSGYKTDMTYVRIKSCDCSACL